MLHRGDFKLTFGDVKAWLTALAMSAFDSRAQANGRNSLGSVAQSVPRAGMTDRDVTGGGCRAVCATAPFESLA
jgi:hypothetical protein